MGHDIPLRTFRHLRHHGLAAVFLVSLLFLSPGPALAAEGPSFDCAKAATIVEKAICKSPDLAALDRQLAAEFKTARGQLSDRGRAALLQEQQDWIESVRVLCGQAVLVGRDEKMTTPACVQKSYSDRIATLGGDGVTIAGIKMRWSHAYYVHKFVDTEGDQTGTYPGFSTLEVSCPIIDTPQSDVELALDNQFAKHRAMPFKSFKKSDEGGSDELVQCSIFASSRKLISMSVTSSSYGHGAAHGLYGSQTINWLIIQKRKLVAEDIFNAQSDWKNFLRKYCFNHLTKDQFPELTAPEDLGDTVFDPARWTLDSGGLHLGPFELGTYADGAASFNITWDELRDYLVADAPIEFDE